MLRTLRTSFSCVIGFLALSTFFGAVPAVHAQRMAVEAIAGQPFGVGRISLPTAPPTDGDPWADGRIDLSEKKGRILYPVFGDGPVRQLLRQFIQRPGGGASIYFLFTGTEPLEITLSTPQSRPIRVVPRPFQPNLYRRTLAIWWREYSRAAMRRSRSSDYPGVVDNYLTATLARRLRLAPVDLTRRGLLVPSPDDGVELLLGTESMKGRIQRADLRQGLTAQATNAVPMPSPIAWPAVTYPEVAESVVVEPIANAVPENCLYLRCGNYTNYNWMQALMNEWGGELRNMISDRGMDFGMRPKIERRLALKDTSVSRTFGGTLISDVAFIGADPFFREGAAFGMVFEARNNFLLSQSLTKQRSDAIAREEGRATAESLQIEGKEVSYISTRDGAVRSYYVRAGDYHLIATSRSLVREFLAIAKQQGKGSLGQSVGFRHARSLLPVDRNDTLFLYLSDAFFHRLATPHYRIEMMRRLRSITEMQSVRLARYAASAEGTPATSVAELVRGGLLPTGFGSRADGSHIVNDDGRLVDSLRGRVGHFTPIPDMEIERVSAREAAEYGTFVRDYQASATRLDPIAVAVVRRPDPKIANQELVTIELRIAPLRAAQYRRWSQTFGTPRKQRIALTPGDLVRVDGIGPQNNYVFLGLQDFNVPMAVRDGSLQWSMPTFELAQAYLGGVPNLGPIERVLNWVRPLSILGPQGDSQWPFGLIERSTGNMTLLGFNRELLGRVTTQLKFEETAIPAQLHIDVADLSRTHLAPAINKLGYQRARKVSIGNTAFMQALSRQLHVPKADCLRVAEALTDGTLSCPLGGEYRLVATPSEGAAWVSTAWTGANQSALTVVPADYVFPIMKWFRGLTLNLGARPDQIAAHIELSMHREAVGGLLGSPVGPAVKPSDGPHEPTPSLPKVEMPKAAEPPAEVLPAPEPVPAPTAKQDEDALFSDE